MTHPSTTNTAIHEAGHAVTAILLGRHVKHASILPNDDHVGHVAYAGRPKRNPSMEETLSYMTTALAGVEAERRAGLRPRRWTWQGDWETAMTGAADLSGGDGEQARLFFRIAQRRARSIIDLRWQTVREIAAMLDDQKLLSGERLREVILPKPPFDLSSVRRLAAASTSAANSST